MSLLALNHFFPCHSFPVSSLTTYLENNIPPGLRFSYFFCSFPFFFFFFFSFFFFVRSRYRTPPANVRQALMTTVSRKAASALQSGEEYLPRPLWVLGNEGGNTVIELVLLNLVRIGLCVYVCVLTKTAHDRPRNPVLSSYC